MECDERRKSANIAKEKEKKKKKKEGDICISE